MPKMSVIAEIGGYPAIFRNSLLAMAHDARHTIEMTEHIPPVETRAQAVHLLDFLLKRVETWPTARDLLISLAPKMELAGHRDDWMPYLEKGIDYSRQQQEIAVEAALTAQLGFLFQLRGQLELAYKYYSQAEALFRSVGDCHNQAQSLNRMGYVAFLLQQYELTEDLANTVLNLRHVEETELAASFNILGMLAATKMEWQIAERHFRQALTIWKNNGNKRHIARRHRALGNLYFKQHRYQDANIQFRQAIDLFGEVGDSVQQAVVRMNLGAICLFNKQPVQALTYFKEAESPLIDVQDIWHLGVLYLNQGIAYHQLKSWTLAEQSFQMSIAYRKRSGNREQIINSLFELGRLYTECKSWSKAEEALNEALEILPILPTKKQREYYRSKLTATIEEIHANKEIVN